MPKARSGRRFKPPYGARLRYDDGDKVKRGERIADWDPYATPILTEVAGKVKFEDLIEGVSIPRRDRRSHRHRQQGGDRRPHRLEGSN